MSTGTKDVGGRRPYSDNGYDADLINAEALAVCDHYLMERRREGRRYVYRCPDCGKLDFEVEPVKGLAGCFNPACPMPKTTNALGIISHLEGLQPRGAEFIRCMEKGYEILGLAASPDAGGATNGQAKNGTRKPPKNARLSATRQASEGDPAPAGREASERDGSPVEQKPQQNGSNEAGSPRSRGRMWIRQNEASKQPGFAGGGDASSGRDSEPSEEADQPPEERPGRPAPQGERVYPIEAYFEGPNGEQIPTEAAVIIEESAAIMELPEGDADPTELIDEGAPDEVQDLADGEAAPGGDALRPPNGREESAPGGGAWDTRMFDRAGSRALADERELRHAVYERLLALCPLEKRDARFFEERGLDHWTIAQGRFGSISAKRSRWVASKLREAFGEDLLKVPGFYRPEAGPEDSPRRGPSRIRFSLHGDYALIPYHDAEGYITTVEGRLIGEPKNERDKKYKALLGSGVHLYVHPRFEPGEVVAFCEGAIGAMVAARYGVPVAAIKGFRNYKVSGRERGDEDTILPELEGVDFAGRTVVYVPDVDVKPQSREEVMGAVPAACEWLIARQGGIPKIALLPEDAKDLDEWLLALPEAERVAEADGLLSGALSLEEWAGSLKDGPHHQPVGGTSRPDDVRPDPEHAPEQVPERHAPERSSPEQPPDRRAPVATRRPGGPEGKSRLLSLPLDDEEHESAAAAGGPSGVPSGASDTKPRATDDVPTREPPRETNLIPRDGGEDAGPKGGPDRKRETSGEPPPAVQDPERARKGPMHPAMERWYEVARYTDEQVAGARQQTAVRKITGKRSPPVRDTPVRLPKWTAGEVILAVALALVVAVVLCLLAYAMRTRAGAIGTVGDLVTWPVWWLEAALYAWAGALTADWTVGRRYRRRHRQLQAHLRGEK